MEECIQHFIESVLRIFKMLVSFLIAYTKEILRLDEFTNLPGHGNDEIVSCYNHGPFTAPLLLPRPHPMPSRSLVLFPS